MVAVVQREWAAKNPRATMKDPITVDDVLNSRMIAYPFRILQCCLVTDGGGALILTSRRPRQGLPDEAGLHPRHRRERGDADGQPDGDFNSSRAFKVAGPTAFQRGRHHAQGRRSPDDLRRLRAPAALRPRRPRLHAARGNRQVHRRRQHRAPAASCRSTPTAAASPTCTPACTACTRCRRACGRCAAPRRRRCRTRRSRSATASAACSPRPARSSSRTRSRTGDLAIRHCRA